MHTLMYFYPLRWWYREIFEWVLDKLNQQPKKIPHCSHPSSILWWKMSLLSRDKAEWNSQQVVNYEHQSQIFHPTIYSCERWIIFNVSKFSVGRLLCRPSVGESRDQRQHHRQSEERESRLPLEQLLLRRTHCDGRRRWAALILKGLLGTMGTSNKRTWTREDFSCAFFSIGFIWYRIWSSLFPNREVISRCVVNMWFVEGGGE